MKKISLHFLYRRLKKRRSVDQEVWSSSVTGILSSLNPYSLNPLGSNANEEGRRELLL